MDRTDARARQHGDGQLGNERKVEGDAVAAFDAERLEDVGKCADLTIEIPVGQSSPIARLAFPDKGGFVAPICPDVPVDAIDADVELTAGEPLRVWRMPLEDRVPRAHPFELVRETGPETLRIGGGAVVDAWIGDLGGLTPLGGRGKAAIFFQKRIDLRHRQTDLSPTSLPGSNRVKLRAQSLSSASERRERATRPARLRAVGATARSRRSFSGGGSAPTKRRARERVGESEGRSPSGKTRTRRRGAASSSELILSCLQELRRLPALPRARVEGHQRLDPRARVLFGSPGRKRRRGALGRRQG